MSDDFEIDPEKTCFVCMDFLKKDYTEKVNDGRIVCRKCYLFNYKYLKSLGLVGKQETQVKLK